MTRRRKRKPRPIGNWFTTQLPLETESTRFVLVNALDLFMTFLLLYFSNRGWMQKNVIESNPAALFFIRRFGTSGLVFFKFGVVVLVLLISQIIAKTRLATARWLLDLGSLVVGGVVVYSLLIMLRHRL